MVGAFSRHIIRPSRLRRILIIFATFTFISSLLRLRTSFKYYISDDDDDDQDPNTSPGMRRRVTAEFMLAIFNTVLSSIFMYVITATSKGPTVYFEGRKVSPEINASFFRWITYNWMNDLMWDGYESALELESLPSMTDQMRARPVYRIFARTRYVYDCERVFVLDSFLRSLLLTMRCYFYDISLFR